MTTKFYTQSHEWIEIKEKVGTVGITNYAQEELGDIVYVQLPKVGQVLVLGQEACVLESTKAAADVYAPVSGQIIAINEETVKDPSLVNRHPESFGWLFQIEISHPDQLDSLLNPEEYASSVNQKKHTGLYRT